MAPEHQALKSLLQGEERKSKVMNKHLADASAKDGIWLAEKIPHAGLSHWKELSRWKRGATQVSTSAYQNLGSASKSLRLYQAEVTLGWVL